MLESQIKQLVHQNFRGRLLKGVLLRSVSSGTSDDFGDPIHASPQEFTFEGFVDTYSAFYRGQAGIPDTDVRVLIIAGSLSVRPVKDDKVKLRNRWYQLRRVETDPAEATWECQAFEIQDPTS